MTTGRSILHSEMPGRSDGLFHGFQIWLNLPSELKMADPAYRDLDPAVIPMFEDGDSTLKLITGRLLLNQTWLTAEPATLSRTNPTIADIKITAGGIAEVQVQKDQKLLVSVFEGEEKLLRQGQTGVYSGEKVTLTAGDSGLRALILAGAPLEEPVVQYGPFVMNTMGEIEQTVSEYNNGNFLSVEQKTHG